MGVFRIIGAMLECYPEAWMYYRALVGAGQDSQW